MSTIFQQCIDNLRETKLCHNQMKLDKIGYIDNDDHGMIPLTHCEGFPDLDSSEDGKAYGMLDIAKNWKLWLTEYHPTYINSHSALAGAWFGKVPKMGGWREEDKWYHLRDLHKKYNFVQSGIANMNHMCPDMRIGLDLGFVGLLDKIRRYRYLNDPVDTGFYDGEETVILGMMEFVRRHIQTAKEMAAELEERRVSCEGHTSRATVESCVTSERGMEDSNTFLIENLKQIAQINENLLTSPPKTLREAVQFLCWFQTFSRMYYTSGAMGQLDQLLRPYYEQDKKNGTITNDEEVIWYIASLLANDTHYSQIGGPHPADGHDISSRISHLILEATHRLKIPCHISLRLHEQYSEELFHKAVTYLFEDGTGVNYSCSGGLDKGYMKNSAPLGLARLRVKSGCNWTAIPGVEYCLQDVSRLCLIKPLLLALDDMFGQCNPELSEGFYTVPGDDERILEELWRRYCEHLAISVKIMKDGMDWHMAHHGRNKPEIVLNLFSHGPIERGLDMVDGGVDIYNLNCDGVGLATVADSFGAIEQRVVKEKRITWNKLYDVLKNNFEGDDEDFNSYENIRLMMKNIARYGSGDSVSDLWAIKIANKYTHLMKDTPTDNGFEMIPGLFSHGVIGWLGKNLGATPNGRKAGEPISHSADPDPGFLKNGGASPTAKANAVAIVQPGYGNSAPLQIDFDTKLAESAGGVEAIKNLILAHNNDGGTLVNINVISKETILQAHKDPSKYPDLVVRVTGYSAFFASLSPEYRQQIVDRLLGCE